MPEAKGVVYPLYVIQFFFVWICVEICRDSNAQDFIFFRTCKVLLLVLVCIIYHLPKFDSVQMYRNLNWLTRTDTGEGLWLVIIIPDLVLNISVKYLSHQQDVPTVLSILLMSIGSVGTLLLIIFIGYRRKTRHGNLFNIIIIVPFIPSLVSYFVHRMYCQSLQSNYTPTEAILLLTAFYLCQLVTSLSFTYSLKMFQRNFSVGEGCMLAQALTVVVLQVTNPNIYGFLHSTDFWMLSDETKISIAMFITGVIIILSLKYSPLLTNTSMSFFVLLSLVFMCVTLPLTWIMLDVFPVVWAFNYLTTSPYKVPLLMWWLLVSLCSILLALSLSSSSSHLTSSNGTSSKKMRWISGKLSHRTVMRKCFHLSAVLIYLPALLLYEIHYLRMVSASAILVFVLAECVRVGRIKPLSSIIQSSYNTFLDQKDQGLLILSHIYLLLACSFPLYLPLTPAHYILTLSGIMSVGVGDAAASVGGTLFGKRHWYSGHKKTVEGTLCSILSQLLVWSLCCAMSSLLSVVDHWPMLVAVPLVSLLESFTDQVDNLVLPPVMCSVLSVAAACQRNVIR